MNMDAPVSPAAAWLMSPPGWPLFLLTAVAVLMSVWAAMSPMPNGHVGDAVMRLQATYTRDILTRYDRLEVRYLISWVAWAAVLLVWFARRIARGTTVMRVAKRKAAPFAYWRRWLAPWLILGATVLFCRTPIPVYVGFRISKGALEDAMRQHKELTAAPPPAAATQLSNPQWALYRWSTRSLEYKWWGVYPVQPVVAPIFADSPHRMVTISNWGGFIYVTPGQPFPEEIRHRMRSLGGGWYTYDDGWGW
jgi:hypothetical protein